MGTDCPPVGRVSPPVPRLTLRQGSPPGTDLRPGGEYPFVLPVVIYNGGRRWTAPTDVADLIAPVPKALLRTRFPTCTRTPSAKKRSGPQG